jgi:ribonuclease III
MSPLPWADSKADTASEDFDGLRLLFRSADLLAAALTHRSVRDRQDNQRLEFLGDAVIELAVRRYLYEGEKGAEEGELTCLKSRLVRKSTLARCADRLGLRERIVTGPGFGESFVSDSMAADAYEAIAGAVFLDRGYTVAQQFVFDTLLRHESPDSSPEPKTILQEYCQGRGLPLPVYRTDRVKGRPHEPIFFISVLVGGRVLGEGRASSKRKAEMTAAAAAVEILEGEDANGLHAQ